MGDILAGIVLVLFFGGIAGLILLGIFALIVKVVEAFDWIERTIWIIVTAFALGVLGLIAFGIYFQATGQIQ